MSFDFKNVPGLTPEIAETLNANKEIQTAISEFAAPPDIDAAVENRVNVAKQEFKRKMDALNAKLQAAESAAAPPPEVLEAAKAAPELQAMLDAAKLKSEAAEAELEKQRAFVEQMRLNQSVSAAIQEFNTANPTVAVKPDVHEWVMSLAEKALRFDPDSNQYRVYNKNGDIIATDTGAATPVDWLSSIRSERPSIFTEPSGGGAVGNSKTNGSADKTISRSEFDALTPLKKAEAASTFTITE